MKSLCSLALFLVLILAEASERPFYAFQNGVRLSTDAQQADLLKQLGYEGIGSARLPKDGGFSELIETYEKRGLKVFSFYTGAKINADGASVPEPLLKMIPQMKGSGVVIEFYVAGNKNHSQEHAINIVRKVADLAADANITMVLYPHTNMYVETLDDAVKLAKAVDRKNVGVMFNLCHFLRVQPTADLRDTLKSAGPLLKQASISGADKGGKDWPSLIQPLGKGSYDVSNVMKTLDSIGFEGPVGLQCYNIKGKPETFLKQSITTWKKLP